MLSKTKKPQNGSKVPKKTLPNTPSKQKRNKTDTKKSVNKTKPKKAAIPPKKKPLPSLNKPKQVKETKKAPPKKPKTSTREVSTKNKTNKNKEYTIKSKAKNGKKQVQQNTKQRQLKLTDSKSLKYKIKPKRKASTNNKKQNITKTECISSKTPKTLKPNKNKRASKEDKKKRKSKQFLDKDMETAKKRLSKRLSLKLTIGDLDIVRIEPQHEKERSKRRKSTKNTDNGKDPIWNDYVSWHGNEAQSVSQLQTFSRSNSKYTTLNYKNAKTIYDRCRHKGVKRNDVHNVQKVQEMKVTIEQYKRRLDEMDNELHKVQKELEYIRIELRNTDEKLKEQMMDNGKIKNILRYKDTEMHKLVKETEGYKGQITQLVNGRNASDKSVIESFQKQAEVLKDEIDELNHKHMDYDDIKRNNDELRGILDGNNDKYMDLEAQFDAITHERNAVVSDLNKESENTMKVQYELDIMQKKYKKLTNDHLELTESMQQRRMDREQIIQQQKQQIQELEMKYGQHNVQDIQQQDRLRAQTQHTRQSQMQPVPPQRHSRARTTVGPEPDSPHQRSFSDMSSKGFKGIKQFNIQQMNTGSATNLNNFNIQNMNSGSTSNLNLYNVQQQMMNTGSSGNLNMHNGHNNPQMQRPQSARQFRSNSSSAFGFGKQGQGQGAQKQAQNGHGGGAQWNQPQRISYPALQQMNPQQMAYQQQMMYQQQQEQQQWLQYQQQLAYTQQLTQMFPPPPAADDDEMLSDDEESETEYSDSRYVEE